MERDTERREESFTFGGKRKKEEIGGMYEEVKEDGRKERKGEGGIQGQKGKNEVRERRGRRKKKSRGIELMGCVVGNERKEERTREDKMRTQAGLHYKVLD